MKNIESICIFGDSTAWGAWDMEKGGWVNRLWLFVGNRDENYKEIYNQSISGGTSRTILARFESEAKSRHADAIIFQTGGNDSAYKLSSNKNLVSIEEFRTNIDEILVKAKNITENVMFIGGKNCDESKTMPVSWIDICYTNENTKRYNQVIREVCEKHKVIFIDNFGLLDNEDFEDGLHPNANGHQKLFERVKDILIENKWV